MYYSKASDVTEMISAVLYTCIGLRHLTITVFKIHFLNINCYSHHRHHFIVIWHDRTHTKQEKYSETSVN